MIVVFLVLSLFTRVDPATVKKINSAKSAAEDAFKSGDYPAAIRHYQFLVDSLGIREDEVFINLANAFYLAKDTASAFTHYQAVTQSPKSDIRSKAHQQLGIMANKQGRAEEALNYFKQAIKAEPSNDDARYNYEMLKKKLKEKKDQEEQQQKNKNQEKKDRENQDPQNEEQQEKDQQQKDQQNKDKQDQDQQQKDQEQKDQEQEEQQQKEQQEKDRQEQQDQQNEREDKMPNLDREKLEQMKISEDKARMILEAMKNQEKQYLQQQKRKPTQARDRNKPDW